MGEHAPAFGGGVAASTLSPIVLVGLIATILLVLAIPRKYVAVAMLPTIFLVPLGQQ
jgi:hypothetical protein